MYINRVKYFANKMQQEKTYEQTKNELNKAKSNTKKVKILAKFVIAFYNDLNLEETQEFLHEQYFASVEKQILNIAFDNCGWLLTYLPINDCPSNHF